MDLPTIEEAHDKENDTFAQGGPLAGLVRQVSRDARQRASKERSGVRSANSATKPPLNMLTGAKSVDVTDKRKYKMYREPGDNDSMGVGLLAARERAKLVPGSRLSHQPDAVHDAYTPS